MSSSALPIGSLNANNTAIKVADGWLSTKHGTKLFETFSNRVYEESIQNVFLDVSNKTVCVCLSDDSFYYDFDSLFIKEDNANAHKEYLKNTLKTFNGNRKKSGDMVFIVNKGEIKPLFLVRTTVAEEGKYNQVAWKLIELDKTIKLKDGSFAHEDWGSNKISGHRVNGNFEWASNDKIYSTFNQAKQACDLPYERASTRNARAMMMMFGGSFDPDRQYSYDDWELHKRKFEEMFALKSF